MWQLWGLCSQSRSLKTECFDLIGIHFWAETCYLHFQALYLASEQHAMGYPPKKECLKDETKPTFNLCVKIAFKLIAIVMVSS